MKTLTTTTSVEQWQNTFNVKSTNCNKTCLRARFVPIFLVVSIKFVGCDRSHNHKSRGNWKRLQWARKKRTRCLGARKLERGHLNCYFVWENYFTWLFMNFPAIVARAKCCSVALLHAISRSPPETMLRNKNNRKTIMVLSASNGFPPVSASRFGGDKRRCDCVWLLSRTLRVLDDKWIVIRVYHLAI